MMNLKQWIPIYLAISMTSISAAETKLCSKWLTQLVIENQILRLPMTVDEKEAVSTFMRPSSRRFENSSVGVRTLRPGQLTKAPEVRIIEFSDAVAKTFYQLDSTREAHVVISGRAIFKAERMTAQDIMWHNKAVEFLSDLETDFKITVNPIWGMDQSNEYALMQYIHGLNRRGLKELSHHNEISVERFNELDHKFIQMKSLVLNMLEEEFPGIFDMRALEDSIFLLDGNWFLDGLPVRV